jgi:hypothetical protein
MVGEDRLPQSVARVKGLLVGTAFFIGKDGSLLTCGHLLYDARSGRCRTDDLEVRFDGVPYPADCIFLHSDLADLDMAVLRLRRRALPEGAVVLPLGRWDFDPAVVRRVRSFGFRSEPGLHAGGEIRGRVTGPSGGRLLQLAAEAAGREEYRPGMSGAPLYDDSTGTIVGMVALREQYAGKLHLPGQHAGEATRYPAETIPFAVPMEEIASRWRPVEIRLQEEDLFQSLLKLLRIGKWFTADYFESFYKSLPFPSLLAYEDLDDDKPRALLEQIREQGLVHDLCMLLQHKYPAIPLTGIDLSPGKRINFVNRNQEQREACNRDGPPLVLLEAPAGYGKTELLLSILARQYRDNWICVHVTTPGDCTRAFDLCVEVARRAGVSRNLANLRTIQEIATWVAAVLDEQMKNDNPGIALFVDCVEDLDEAAIKEFLDKFLGYLQGMHTVRVFFAGRYVSSRWERQAGDLGLGLMILRLTPFRFRYVQQTVKQLSPEDGDVDLLAAYLMHVTGGHPGCMAEIMNQMDFSGDAETYFAAHQAQHRARVLQVVDDVRASIDEGLRDVFEALSVFRRYTYHMLTRILETDLVAYEGNAVSLDAALTATYLVDRKQGFIQDEIVRRLFANQLRWRDPDRFLALCKLARSLYLEALPSRSNPHAMLLELLYQELMIGYYEGGQTGDDRAGLKRRFLGQDGILHRHLALLRAREDEYEDAKRNLLASLRDEDENWEFRFTINFTLRQDGYNNDPFDAMRREVEAFFALQEDHAHG